MPFDILFAMVSFVTLVLAWTVLPGESRTEPAPAAAPVVEPAGA
jgi:hypothetical protein